MPRSIMPSRRLSAGAAFGALLASSLLFTSPAHAANKVITSNLVDQSETRATGHNVFGDDGVHVYTEGATSTDKAAGYFDVDTDLADAGEPTLSWSGSAARPGTQLVTDFDNDGNIDGILVGEPANKQGSVPDWWVSNAADQNVKDGAPSQQGGDVPVGGSGSSFHGTLDQWRAAFPEAKVFQTGWSLGSGVKGDGTINSITFGDDEYFFVKGDSVSTKVLYNADVDEEDTRSAGHSVFRPTTGIHVYTDDGGGLAKADGYFAAPQALATAGEPSMAYRTISGTIPPGLQLEIDFDGDGTLDGKLVGEPKFYGNDWWLAGSSDQDIKDRAPRHTGGFGSANHGLLSEWRAEFPEADILRAGYSLGSGVQGDYIIDAITVGLTRFIFSGANVAPTASPVTGSTGFGTAVTVSLKGEDKNEDQLTYTATAEHGEVAIDGDELTFTPDDGFAGTASFGYTVDDGKGETASSTVSIDVAKATSATTATSNTTSYRNTYVSATVTPGSPGAEVDGGTVTVKEGANTVGSATVVDGKVKVLVSKLSGGSHTFTTSFGGTSTTGSSSDSVVVQIGASSLTLASNTTSFHNTYVTATVSTSSGSVEGATVTVKEGTKKVGTAVVTGGVAKVFVGKNVTKGAHTYAVSFPGTATVAPSSKTIKVTIK